MWYSQERFIIIDSSFALLILFLIHTQAYVFIYKRICTQIRILKSKREQHVSQINDLELNKTINDLFCK
jgi:hypothetical protein